MLYSLILVFAVLAAAHGDPNAQALIELALRGRRAAVRSLTRRLLPVVHARVNVYFSRRGGQMMDGQDAHDLAQDAWLRLFANDGALLRAYDPERGKSLEGYVGMLVRRELWIAAERAGRAKRGGGERGAELNDQTTAGGVDDPERTLVERDLLDRVWAYLESQLPARGALVLRLLYEDDVKPAEAAELMGVKLQVVYNWQHKIRGLARSWYATQAG